MHFAFSSCLRVIPREVCSTRAPSPCPTMFLFPKPLLFNSLLTPLITASILIPATPPNDNNSNLPVLLLPSSKINSTVTDTRLNSTPPGGDTSYRYNAFSAPTADTTQSTNTSSLTTPNIVCNGQRYGRNLRVASCLEAYDRMDGATVPKTYGDRDTEAPGHTFWDAVLPIRIYSCTSPSPRPNAIDKRPLPPQPTPSAPSTSPTRPPPAPTPSPPPCSNPTPAPSSPSASKAPPPSAASRAGWATTVIWRSEWRPIGPKSTASDRARARRGLRVATSSTPCPLRGSRSGSVPWTMCWRMWWCRGWGRRGERGKGGAGAALYVGFSSSSSSSCLRGFMVAVWDIERPWRRKGWRRIDRPSTPFPRPTSAISTSSGPRPAPWRPCAFPRARRAWRLGMVSY